MSALQRKPTIANQSAAALLGRSANASDTEGQQSGNFGSSAKLNRSQVPEEEQGGMFLSSTKPIPLQYVVKNVEERISKSDLYGDFIIYWPFLGCFLIFFLAGRDIEKNHMASSSVRWQFLDQPFQDSKHNSEIILNTPNSEVPDLEWDRSFRTIKRAADWHEWFRDVLIPYTWDCRNPGFSRQTLRKRGQLEYIGAMKLRVILMKPSSCEFNPYLKDNSSTKPYLCYDEHDRNGEEDASLCAQVNPGNPLQNLWRFYGPTDVNGGVYTTGSEGYYHPGGYVADLPFNSTCNMIEEFRSTLLSSTDPTCNIVDDTRTRFVMVEWFQYSANTDTFLTAKFFMELRATGGWVSNYQVRMFPVWTTKRLWSSIFDIFFFLFVLYFLYRVLYDWVIFYRRNKKILAFVFDLWNLLEVCNIATFLAVFILRWMWWSQSNSRKISFPFGPEYPQQLDRLVLMFSAQIYANSVNVVMTVIKVLKFVRLNNRLNVLTRTLAIAQQSIFGVLLLFVFVVLGYAICGTALYGGNMWRFRNINTSFSGLMFMLLGEFDYVAMRAQQPTLTGLYFFSYVVLANFLLLNFIIAILSEGFAQVSGETALEPLDASILRQISLIKYTLNPRNLKKILELRIRQKTRTDLLVEVVKYLKEHMDLIELQAPELLDSDLPMYKTDLKQWLPEHLNQDLGDYYTDLLWDDIEHEYRIDAQSDTYQEKKDIEETILAGVGRVVGRRLNNVDKLTTQALAMDETVARIASLAQEVFGDGTN